MRTTGATLLAAQKSMGDALVKVVFTKAGQTTRTYGVDTINRILNLSHSEQEWGQVSQVLIDNRDGNLTALALEGYAGIISYGYHTTEDEYSATAPLTVLGYTPVSGQGERVTTITLAGLFNMWSEQEATEAYKPDEINTDVVKTILDAIAGATMTCFSSYPAHTITYDTGYDDSIINAFKPADNFSVAKGESRLSAFKKALAWTKCKTRVENDSSVATIHIYQPTITGTTYDSEYTNVVTDHNFFEKSVRKRLVLPNKVVVMNHPEHTDSYTGSATDAASYAALGNQYYTKTVYCRPSSNAQAALIAAGILLKYQLAAEKGHGTVPMNVYQEYCDYVKITDSWASDERIGNIGYLNRWYSAYPKQPTRFGMEFRFGTLEILGLAGTVPPAITSAVIQREDRTYQGIIDQIEFLTENYNAMRESVLSSVDTINALIDYLLQQQWDSEVWSLSVLGRLQIPHGTNMYT